MQLPCSTYAQVLRRPSCSTVVLLLLLVVVFLVSIVGVMNDTDSRFVWVVVSIALAIGMLSNIAKCYRQELVIRQKRVEFCALFDSGAIESSEILNVGGLLMPYVLLNDGRMVKMSLVCNARTAITEWLRVVNA